MGGQDLNLLFSGPNSQPTHPYHTEVRDILTGCRSSEGCLYKVCR